MVLEENDNGGGGGSGGGVWLEESHEEHDDGSLSQFKPMLAGDWFSNSPQHDLQPHQDFRFLDGFRFNQNDNLLLQHSIDSSSSCSPSQTFNFDPLQHQEQSFLATNPYVASLLSVPSANPFNNAFEFTSQSDILRHLHGNQSMGFSGLSSGSDLSVLAPENRATLRVSEYTTPGLESVTNGGFGNRAKVLKPLEVLPSSGSQPTLFQKRAAMRQSSESKIENSEISEIRKLSDKVMGKTKIEISGFNYESDEVNESFKAAESVQNGGSSKGKKKGMPAKNLMAERRRRKKLNDRLYMLRSVVPKISKMDRASILGDAVDYLMELLQRINDLHKELDSNPQTLSSPHPLTPTPQMLLPSRVREELCTSSLSSPKEQQARVEVRVREGRAVHINMFCGRKAGVLLATMRALDNLGLDVQQAVISCFNGFSLDVFRAECEEGREILPEQIKAVLLDTVGYAAVI